MVCCAGHTLLLGLGLRAYSAVVATVTNKPTLLGVALGVATLAGVSAAVQVRRHRHLTSPSHEAETSIEVAVAYDRHAGGGETLGIAMLPAFLAFRRLRSWPRSISCEAQATDGAVAP